MTKAHENHGTGFDDIWETSNFTGLHGTGHGFHWDLPKFHGTSLHGIGISKKNTGRDRDREHFHGISLDGMTGFAKFHGITGLSRIPYTEESRGIFTAGTILRKALVVSG